MSVIARCAATPRTCDSANDVTAWTMVASTGGEGERHQHVRPALADDVVDQELGRGGKHETHQAVDQHERQAERQPALAREDQGARLAPGRLSRNLLLRSLGRLGDASGSRLAPARCLGPRHPQPSPQSTRHMPFVSTIAVAPAHLEYDAPAQHERLNRLRDARLVVGRRGRPAARLQGVDRVSHDDRRARVLAASPDH